MGEGAADGTVKKKKSLKDDAKVSRRQMLAIWAALATALGSQGIPAIVAMIDSKPDAAEVQQMIAQQTTKLTEQQNMAVEALKELHLSVKELKGMGEDVSFLRGHVEVMRDVIRGCCVSRRALRKLDDHRAVKRAPLSSPEPSDSFNSLGQLQKVPAFKADILDKTEQTQEPKK